MSNDAVNSPAHYTQSNIECIDAIEASMGMLEFSGFLKGQVMKYIWRYRHKGRMAEDLEKAGWYLHRLTHLTMLLERDQQNAENANKMNEMLKMLEEGDAA